MWKLMLINSAVILLTIWFAGFSVKEFACLLVERYQMIGDENGALFNQTLQVYLLKASMAAILVTGLLHYFFVRKLIRPLKQLAQSARSMAKGSFPTPLPISSKDEIGSLTSDFNFLVQKLKEMEENRNKMIMDISHELRTPLTNINGYLEGLSSGVMQGNPELFASLLEESQHISRLVDQIHQLHRWQSKKKFETKTIRMDELIRYCVAQFQLEFETHGIQLDCQLESCLMKVDEDGIKQVMYNLLRNAVKYDVGGWIKIHARTIRHAYEVVVTNQGQPIPASLSEQVFERFYRLDPSRNRETGGSGLGLAIVKEIIEQHGGHVGLRTKHDHHSFWFTLPISE